MDGCLTSPQNVASLECGSMGWSVLSLANRKAEECSWKYFAHSQLLGRLTAAIRSVLADNAISQDPSVSMAQGTSVYRSLKHCSLACYCNQSLIYAFNWTMIQSYLLNTPGRSAGCIMSSISFPENEFGEETLSGSPFFFKFKISSWLRQNKPRKVN